jgi:transcriptional regulator with PAS, ATPase and Fis domain
MKSAQSVLSQINLLLNHIISFFNVKLAFLWIASSDLYFATSKYTGHAETNSAQLNTFLAGCYHNSFHERSLAAPIILHALREMPNIPDKLVQFAEAESITAIVILPMVHKRRVKGAIAIGTNDNLIPSNGKMNLLALFLQTALYLVDKREYRVDANTQIEPVNKFGLIVGQSADMQEIYKTIRKISDSDANVFVTGESGTGKELIARTIHAESKRKSHPFIPVDCVALPESLLESELFGYEKGAFTGANNLKRGLIEYSHGGTCFFDEITEMNIELQAKLLRVLQERQFRRVGGNELLNVNIRVISATNRQIKKAIADKRLREDLFYRLNVIPIHLPPLRDRIEDIPLFVEHFIKLFSKSQREIGVSQEAMKYLINYGWPGNVRELRNAIERVVALSKHSLITVEDLPGEILRNTSTTKFANGQISCSLPYLEAKEQNLLTFEKTYFCSLLDKYHGNISRVAKEAKVSRKTIYAVLKKHNFFAAPIYSN